MKNITCRPERRAVMLTFVLMTWCFHFLFNGGMSCIVKYYLPNAIYMTQSFMKARVWHSKICTRYPLQNNLYKKDAPDLCVLSSLCSQL